LVYSLCLHFGGQAGQLLDPQDEGTVVLETFRAARRIPSYLNT